MELLYIFAASNRSHSFIDNDYHYYSANSIKKEAINIKQLLIASLYPWLRENPEQ